MCRSVSGRRQPRRQSGRSWRVCRALCRGCTSDDNDDVVMRVCCVIGRVVFCVRLLQTLPTSRPGGGVRHHALAVAFSCWSVRLLSHRHAACNRFVTFTLCLSAGASAVLSQCRQGRVEVYYTVSVLTFLWCQTNWSKASHHAHASHMCKHALRQ